MKAYGNRRYFRCCGGCDNNPAHSRVRYSKQNRKQWYSLAAKAFKARERVFNKRHMIERNLD